ncbi:MAG: hypothetical protein RL662_639 [Bacteroidota bacterium]|jgi:hypothetical protein
MNILKKILKYAKEFFVSWGICGVVLCPIVFIHSSFYWFYKDKMIVLTEYLYEIFLTSIPCSLLFILAPVFVAYLMLRFYYFEEKLLGSILFFLLYIFTMISGFLYFKGYIFIAALIILIVTYNVIKRLSKDKLNMK